MKKVSVSETRAFFFLQVYGPISLQKEELDQSFPNTDLILVQYHNSVKMKWITSLLLFLTRLAFIQLVLSL